MNNIQIFYIVLACTLYICGFTLVKSGREISGLIFIIVDQHKQDRPIRKIGNPKDVDDAVLCFASDLASWITGAHLVVDGGGMA